MRVAILPDGITLNFPDDISDVEMDAAVQRYLSSTEAVQGISKIADVLSAAIDTLKTLVKTTQEQQATALKAIDAAAKQIAEALEPQDNSKLQTAVESLVKTGYDMLATVNVVARQNARANDLREEAVNMLKAEE